MEYRYLGSSGLRVSVVGIGANNFDRPVDLETTRRIVHAALDLGVTLIDTADSYAQGGSESFLGETLGLHRRDVVLATKFGNPMDGSGFRIGGSRRWIMAEVEQSLRRLRTDYIDLYQFHRPDPRTPIEETLRALDDLVHQGKVRCIGCANFAAWQVAEAEGWARALGIERFVSCQNEYSVLVRKAEAELLPAARQYGLGFLPYYPLASGLLTGKYRGTKKVPGTRLTDNAAMASRFLSAATVALAEKLAQFAKQRGRSLIELAFGWLLAQSPVSSVIAGVTKVEQIVSNAQAAGWKLTAEELVEVGRIITPAV